MSVWSRAAPAQHIKDKLGGRVVVESEVGQGSVFGFIVDAVGRGRRMETGLAQDNRS
jgi:hypothetical protein